jgi:hypothetical protein
MLVYVTSFLDIYPENSSTKTVEQRIEHFRALAESGAPIALYISPNIQERIQDILIQYPNVRLISTMTLEDLPLYQMYINHPQQALIQKPLYGSKEKDTIPYLILQNSKATFLDLTIQTNLYPDATHYAWIDFSIFHVISQKETIQRLLQIYATERHWPTPLLAFPGCHEKGKYPKEFLLNQPCWRFCGGFFLGDKESIQEFHTISTNHFQWFLNTYQVLPWEVNIWASMELENDWKPDIYMANHDDSMIVVPNEYNDPLYVYPHSSYYKTPLLTIAEKEGATQTPLTFPQKDELDGFVPSSTSYMCFQGVHLLNTRFVNYNLTPQGAYIIHDTSGNLRTKNVLSICNPMTLDPLTQIVYNTERLPLRVHSMTIQGLEDIRMYIQEGKLKVLATQRMYSTNHTNRMFSAELNLPHGTLSEFQILQPPTQSSCEKNWIPLPTKDTFIYQWHPYTIGKVRINYKTDTNDFEIEKTYATPSHFERIRGSSVPFLYKGQLWCMVHFSEETCPRTYYHQMVILDSQTYLPVQISQPFRFRGKGIEFCIGFTIQTTGLGPEKAHAWTSHHDKDPVHYTFSMEGIKFFVVEMV